jgi:sterol desaturase/sphingolipid hydroxylase (fatty acid hydroxylase superfamily)
VAGVGGVVALGAGAVAAVAAVDHLTAASRLWEKGRRRDLGTGVAAWGLALVGWDLVYYLNHRMMHEVRWNWAYHVVHHSSERFNLSTALRQPVSGFGVFMPYGALARLGVRPALIEYARGINLLYQFWIHTEAIGSLGRAEGVLNSPSHHRVHHGSNARYLDRNHAGILIVWDRLLGTFEREDPADPPVYGLTRNIHTFNPARIVAHEYLDMVRDVASATTWRDRLGFVLRGPGWAYRRRAERGAPTVVS